MKESQCIENNKPQIEYKDIGLKEIKFCKYCGSENIMQSKGVCKQYYCLQCGTQGID